MHLQPIIAITPLCTPRKPGHFAVTFSPTLYSLKALRGSAMLVTFTTLPLIGSSFTQMIRTNIPVEAIANYTFDRHVVSRCFIFQNIYFFWRRPISSLIGQVISFDNFRSIPECFYNNIVTKTT